MSRDYLLYDSYTYDLELIDVTDRSDSEKELLRRAHGLYSSYHSFRDPDMQAMDTLLWGDEEQDLKGGLLESSAPRVKLHEGPTQVEKGTISVFGYYETFGSAGFLDTRTIPYVMRPYTAAKHQPKDIYDRLAHLSDTCIRTALGAERAQRAHENRGQTLKALLPALKAAVRLVEESL